MHYPIAVLVLLYALFFTVHFSIVLHMNMS
jgi:hypothetical protein